MSERQQQKLLLTPDTRAKLRKLAEDRDVEMSVVVEELIVNEASKEETR